MEIHIGDRVAEIELVSKEDNKVVLTIDGKPFEADVVMAENGTCNILMDGRCANACWQCICLPCCPYIRRTHRKRGVDVPAS